MRFVEVEGSTVDEATASALRELGVDVDAVDVEVLRAPRRGLFGNRGKAMVRVTVRTDAESSLDQPEPSAAVRESLNATEGPDNERHDAGPATGVQSEEDTEMTEADVESDVETPEIETPEIEAQEQVDIDALSPEERVELLDEECDLAADFVEGLLDLLDLPGDIEIEVTEDGAVVNVSDVGSGLLIGRRGATLDALQELVRSTTQRQTERRSQVRVDVEGYRARQLEKLRSKCRDAIAQVRETGEPYKLEPMDAYERKMMHDLVARTGGVTSSSEGAEPKRRVVILPE